jgi:hypothetical protein
MISAITCVMLVMPAISHGATPVKPFATGVDEPATAAPTKAIQAMARTTSVGAKYVRVDVSWAGIAPAGTAKPAGFDPRNPSDPNYRWSTLDAQLRSIVASGQTPYLMIYTAPKWAQVGAPPGSGDAGNGAWKPNNVEFGNFAHAAAIRYSGTYVNPAAGGLPLPRVALWQAWNEPNLPLFLAPTSPELYRLLLNSFYDEVKAVQPDAQVITAGLAPVKSSPGAAFPKEFAQALLCIEPSNGTYARDNSCGTPAKFDIFSVHPYSLRAKPNQRAAVDGNMFVADVVDINQMLVRAQKTGAVLPGLKQLWATEFSWITNPPNKTVGDPPALAGVRASIALYLLWHAGVSQVTWELLSDKSGGIVIGGGVYDSNDRPKPTRTALHFPFYIQQKGRKAYTWGKAPAGNKYRVLLMRHTKGDRYKTVMRIKPDANGMFSVRFKTRSKATATYMAVQHGDPSLGIGSRAAFE